MWKNNVIRYEYFIVVCVNQTLSWFKCNDIINNIHYENNGNYQKTYISSEFEENKLNCHESEKCINKKVTNKYQTQ